MVCLLAFTNKITSHCGFVFIFSPTTMTYDSIPNRKYPGSEVIKNFMLNSAGHEIFPAHKRLNANNSWLTEPEKKN